MVNGIGASYVGIFSPVWIDQFSPKNRSSIMMAAHNLSSVLGVILGFIMTSIIEKTEMPWNLSYLIQAFMLGAGIIIVLLMKNRYFDRRLIRIKDSCRFYVQEDENIEEHSKSNNEINISYNNSNEIISNTDKDMSKDYNITERSGENIDLANTSNVSYISKDNLFRNNKNTKKSSNSLNEITSVEENNDNDIEYESSGRGRSGSALALNNSVSDENFKRSFRKKISYYYVFKSLINNSVSTFYILII